MTMIDRIRAFSFGRWLSKFALEAASARPLAVLRIGLSLVLLVQAAMVAPEYFEIYGRDGILQGGLVDYFTDPALPTLMGLSRRLLAFGVSERATLLFFGMAYVVSLCGLLLGWHTRLFSILSWLTHTIIAGTHFTAYGADQYSHFCLFYFMWMPIGDALSLDVASGRNSGAPSWAARLSLRVVQIHLSIAYVASAIEKGTGPQWWNGDAIWRSLMLPLYNQMDFAWLANVPWLAVVLGWGTLLIEGGYPLFMGIPQTRRLWVALTISLHLGIVVFLGLGSFGCLMSILTLAAFGISAEPAEKASPVSFPGRGVAPTQLSEANAFS